MPADPVHHGTMSGLLKDALDHPELLRDDGRPYFTVRGRATHRQSDRDGKVR